MYFQLPLILQSQLFGNKLKLHPNAFNSYVETELAFAENYINWGFLNKQ